MHRFMVPLLLAGVAVVLVGCSGEAARPPRLRVSSAQAAAGLVQLALKSARAPAADARGFCGGPEARAHVLARLWPNGSASGVVEVLRSEAAWAGSEPYFRVVLGLPHDGVVDQAALAVRAREGCIDAASLPVPAAAAADEISL